MDEQTARRAIIAVMQTSPRLTYYGLDPAWNDDFQDNRRRLAGDGVEEFQRAVAWLARVPKRPVAGTDHDSQGLRHAAEDWSGDVIGNGAFIAAALHLGFPVEWVRGTHNALIGVEAGAQWPRKKVA